MDLEMISFEIISNVGEARSLYIEAIQIAKEGDISKAHELITEGDEAYKKGHAAHMKLVQQEASGESVGFNLILMHAEDQLIAADSFKIIALEFIDLYERLKNE